MSSYNHAPPRSKISAAKTLALQTLLATLVAADCYVSSGEALLPSDGVFPCNNGTNTCCSDEHQCSSNLLCVAEGGWSTGGLYCDNEAWEGCSSFCDVYPLPECGPNIFCCPVEENNYECDCDTDPTWFVDPATGEVSDAKDIDLNDAAASASPTFWAVDKESVSTSSTATSGTTATAGEETLGVWTATMTRSPRRSTTTTASSSTTSTFNFESEADSFKGSSKKSISGGAIGGLVIGVVATLAVVVGVASFLWRRSDALPAPGGKVSGVKPAPGGYGFVATDGTP